MRDFRLTENTLVTVNTCGGFFLKFTCNMTDMIGRKTLYYGFIVGDMSYSIHYNACNEAYCQKDVATFQEVLNSFSVLQARVM